MITRNQVIKAIGCDKLELVQGEGYLYFVYDDLDKNNIWADHSVYVCRLNQLSLEQWVSIGKDFVKICETEK